MNPLLGELLYPSTIAGGQKLQRFAGSQIRQLSQVLLAIALRPP